MSETSGAPAADAGISKTELEAAVKTARAEGEAAGMKAATERFAAVLGAEAIKGDSSRTKAAFDLAVSAPSMAAEQIVAFVSANVGPSTTGPTLSQRMAGVPNPPIGHGAAGETGGEAVASAFDRSIKRRNGA